MTEQCERCNGTGEVDSGAPDPQGHFIKIPCECHTEHVHEWIPRALDWDHIDGVCCNVPGCGAQMDNEEMNARLNATERLSAEDARVAANDLQQSRQVNELLTDIETIVTLRAYADIRDGKGGDDD